MVPNLRDIVAPSVGHLSVGSLTLKHAGD